MRLLLDTHIALWAISDDPRLTNTVRRLISDSENEIFVSSASVWEIAIKHALGGKRKDAMPISGTEADRFFALAGYQTLPIRNAHAVRIDTLPKHHSDPFDRIILAQALVEPMKLLTHDAALSLYGDLVVSV